MSPALTDVPPVGVSDTVSPIPGSLFLMREGDHENLILEFLVHDDVRKTMEEDPSCTALEWRSEVGIRLYEVQRAREVSITRELARPLARSS